MKGDFISRHHVESPVQLYVPKEETFLIPLKYIHVTRSDGYWNVDVGSKFVRLTDRIHEVYTIQ